MKIILPEVQLKQRLLSDNAYLKEYVQKLLTSDSDFIDNYLAQQKLETDIARENKYLYEHNITNLSDEYINFVLTSLSTISDENLRTMFDTPESIDIYIDYIKSIRKSIEKKFPKIYIETLYNTDKTRQLVESKCGTLFKDYNDYFGTVKVSALPEFFDEEDINLLEQDQPISKIIDGKEIKFKFASSRYAKTSGYYTEALKASPEYKEKLTEVIEEYKDAVTNQYPKQKEQVADCNKKIVVLSSLKEQYENPNIGQQSHSFPKH